MIHFVPLLIYRWYRFPRATQLIHSGKRWKQYYAEAEADSRRLSLTMEELCGFHWAFCFQTHLFERLQDELPVYDYPRFHLDHTYTSMLFPRVMHWQFSIGRNAIQIEQFPTHVISRTANWGWRMTNRYVIFTSMDVDDNEFAVLEEQMRNLISRRFLFHALHDHDGNEDDVVNDFDADLDADVVLDLDDEDEDEPGQE